MAKYGIGQFDTPVQFEVMTEVENENYGFDLVPVSFDTRAHFLYLRGGEVVQAARLAGKQPVVVTVRRNLRTQQINFKSTMTNKRTGEKYDIKQIVPTDDRQFLEITAESGLE